MIKLEADQILSNKIIFLVSLKIDKPFNYCAKLTNLN